MFVLSNHNGQTRPFNLKISMNIRIIRFAILAALVTISSLGRAQQPTSATMSTRIKAGSGNHKLTIVLSGVNSRTGKFYVGLANNEETFTKKSLRDTVVSVPASGEVAIVFDKLTAGRYAVRVYQDLNDNRIIDFSGQIPAEPFGFSNVAMVMGPPTFDQCAFDLAENKSISVNLIEM